MSIYKADQDSVSKSISEADTGPHAALLQPSDAVPSSTTHGHPLKPEESPSLQTTQEEEEPVPFDTVAHLFGKRRKAAPRTNVEGLVKGSSPSLPAKSPVTPTTPTRRGPNIVSAENLRASRRLSLRSSSGWSDTNQEVTHALDGYLKNAKIDKRLRSARPSAEYQDQMAKLLESEKDTLFQTPTLPRHKHSTRSKRRQQQHRVIDRPVSTPSAALADQADAASAPLPTTPQAQEELDQPSNSVSVMENSHSLQTTSPDIEVATPCPVLPRTQRLTARAAEKQRFDPEYEVQRAHHQASTMLPDPNCNSSRTSTSWGGSVPGLRNFSAAQNNFVPFNSNIYRPIHNPTHLMEDLLRRTSIEAESSALRARLMRFPHPVQLQHSFEGHNSSRFFSNSRHQSYGLEANQSSLAGQGRPLQNVSNIASQNNQSRNQTASKLQPSKPTTWAQAGILNTSNTSTQSRDSGSAVPENSWAQTMGGSRPNTQLDLSSSSFPSLNNNGPQSQSFSGSSAWQTGPPQSEQGRRQLQSSRQQLPSRQQQGPGAEGFYPTDTFSRNAQVEYPVQDPIAQSNRRSSVAPNGPPGLSQRQGQIGEGLSGDSGRVTSPAGFGQDSRPLMSQALNGAVGQERPSGEIGSSSVSQPPRDGFAPRESFEQGSEQTVDSLFAGMSEKDKYGMKGYLALAEGPNATFRHLMRGQDLGALGLNMNSDTPLLSTYAGPFALPNAHPLRPLEADFTVPECYTVKEKVTPLHTRINSFSDETLFYIFYSMPRDYMQVLVAQELMERKWRYHMREQMWLMRDEATGSYVMSDDRMSEHGYYIWWDKNLWKKVRRAYTLRYEDLDDVPNVANRRILPGMGGMGGSGGVNGGGATSSGLGSAGPAGQIFNAVPGLEKMAASGRGF